MAQLDELMKTLATEAAKTVVRSPSSTLEPPSDHALGRKAFEVLKGLSHDSRALVKEGPLGEGGMGVVHTAHQVALNRKVAVKSLHEGTRSEKDVEALLSEAWRAGALEHPNILPIHALALDDAGLPVIVMKRIEGRTWLSLLRDDALMEEHAPGRPRLEEHLRILGQVCNAVHFAHTRGVVHRDLKPENVMVGAFGEVYVVDWGLACPPGPSLQLAGTPAYMAPEMLGGGSLSPRTDVYLLGAMLFDVLAGRAPHRGATPVELFKAVLESRPELPADAPETLASLVRRCMAAEPEARPASALEVRLELEAFAQRQGSMTLADQAFSRLAALTGLLANEEPDVTRVYSLFSASRFGFEQALASWPGNARAREGWSAAMRHLVAFEAQHGSAKTARAYYVELNEPDAALEEKLLAAEAREAAHQQQLQKLKQLESQLDPNTGAVQRAVMALLLGAMWILSPHMEPLVLQRFPHFEGISSIPGCFISIVLVSFFAWRRRHTVAETPLNRQLVAVVLFGMSVQIVLLLTRYVLFGPWGPEVVPLLAGYWAVIAGLTAVTLLPSMWLTSAGYAIGAIGAAIQPEYRTMWVTFANSIFFVNSLLVARRLQRERRERLLRC